MKKVLILLAAGFGGFAIHAAVIDRVIIRQQWPWSTDVKIEYQISGVDAAAPVDIVVTAYDGATQLEGTHLQESLKGDIYGIVKNGMGTIMLDPVKAFGAEMGSLNDFSVELSVTSSSANVREVLYKIIDLDTGDMEDLRRCDFYNGKYGSYETSFSKIKSDFTTTLTDVLIWTEVTNRIDLMTNKMAFRKISAKNVVWQMGETDNGPNGNDGPDKYMNDPFWAKLDADFFIGVFPVTQAQYYKLRSDYGACCTNAEQYPNHLHYPVAGMQLGDVITDASYAFLKKFSSKCGLTLTLPTEAQWEFACRGGVYDKALYSGKTYSEAACSEISWNRSSSGNTTMCEVGYLPPNAYGLYNLLGNAGEFCSTRWFSYPTESSQASPELNPGHTVTSGNFVWRGANYTLNYKNVSAAKHVNTGQGNPWKSYGVIGFRVSFAAE